MLELSDINKYFTKQNELRKMENFAMEISAETDYNGKSLRKEDMQWNIGKNLPVCC